MIQIIDIELLVPFENHPFKERSGIEQQELTESIKENGLLEPIIARPFPAGKYEIISGHRRVEACKALGITSIPVTIKELTKDEAIVQMVDSNIHREHILPSEKSFAYKMKLEALKHQGKTYGQVVHKSRDNISDTESGRNVQRYIRLTYLIPELLRLVDEERIAFTPAVEISYLSEYEQRTLLDQIEFTDATPSLSQAQRLRKFSKEDTQPMLCLPFCVKKSPIKKNKFDLCRRIYANIFRKATPNPICKRQLFHCLKNGKGKEKETGGMNDDR